MFYLELGPVSGAKLYEPFRFNVVYDEGESRRRLYTAEPRKQTMVDGWTKLYNATDNVDIGVWSGQSRKPFARLTGVSI